MSLWTSTDDVAGAGKPKYLNATDKANTYGVDTTEIGVDTSDNVVATSIISAGTGYASAPTVTVSAGNATVVATVSGGKVTALAIGASGNTDYASAPTLSVAPPVAKQFNGAGGVDSNAITFTAHGFATGDALTYAHSGGSVVVGLTTATTYYAIRLAADTLSLATTLDNANAGTVITLADGSGANHTLTGTTATATVSLGEGLRNITHTGWNLRTVGTGGRAGRVFWENLVASNISGDATEDGATPDA